MANPTNLAYTKEHEWVLVEGSVATVGITKYAADALGEVVYIDLPKVGAATTYLKIFGEVESTKSVSELYSPITGEVVEVNATVTASPELINSDAFGPTTTPPITVPPVEAKSFMKPSSMPEIFARGFTSSMIL